jgi:2-polyprenyl-3-methyl-5-hydroxy-6-metoxy-1,4-benzoquinol methylase
VDEDGRLAALARAHDALAPTYDDLLAQNPVATWMRRQLWRHYSRVFSADAPLLDLGAGTGADALFLAQRGAHVVALDVSAGMVAELQRRAAARRLDIDARVLAIEQLGSLACRDRFDGAIAGFAALNTIEELSPLAADLARLINPGGRVILHALNAFCVWESVNRLLHGRLPRARVTRTPIGGELVAHRFYHPFRLWREVFSADFALRQVYALSVLAAPSWVRRLGRLAPPVLAIDGLVGRLLPTCGDFFVMDLERRVRPG